MRVVDTVSSFFDNVKNVASARKLYDIEEQQFAVCSTFCRSFAVDRRKLISYRALAYL